MSQTNGHTEKVLLFNHLVDQYHYMGLPIDIIDEKNAFTIHNIADVHHELPYRSEVYRVNFYSFVFVKEGKGKYTTDDKQFDTSPGTIYFTNPGHFKSFEWQTLKEVYLVTLNEAFLKENVHPNIFREFPFLLAETVPPRTLPPSAFAEFEELYLQINKAYHAASPYKFRIIGSLFVVILLRIKEYFWEDYNPIYEGNRSSQIVKQFKRTLEEHYRDLVAEKVDKPYRVQDYARLQNLHPTYLSNVIKSKTGKAIANWISEKTVTEASALLQHSSLSVKQIADRLGFTEAAHFSNYYKKHTGHTPLAYRKQQKAEP